MDEGHEPERIEIELTSHEPAAGRTAGGGLTPSGQDDATAETAGPGVLGTERGRLLVVAAGVAVIALTVGVLVGRLGANDLSPSDDAASTPTAVAATTDPEPAGDTLPPAPGVLTPPVTTAPASTVSPTTRPSRVPGTTAGPEGSVRVTGGIAIHPDLPPDAVELVVLTGAGDVMRIDATDGTFVTTTLVHAGLDGPPEIRAGPGWVVVPSYDQGPGAAVIFDDGARSSIDLGPWWPTLGASADGTFWRADIDQETGVLTRLTDVAIDGSETGAAIELDGFYPHMTDPLGGVVVQAPGGYYTMRPDSRARLTSGQLIALGERRALVSECDDRLACGYHVVDRATEVRTPLVLDPALGERPQIESGGFWSVRNPMSPDEDAVLVVTWDGSGGGRQVIGVLDLATGGHTEVGTFVDTPQMEWSTDGRRIYWLSGGRLEVFDRSTGESVVFSDDLGTLAAMTLRPSVGAVDASDTDESG